MLVDRIENVAALDKIKRTLPPKAENNANRSKQYLKELYEYRTKNFDDIKAQKKNPLYKYKNLVVAGREIGPDQICFCCEGVFFPHSAPTVNKRDFFDAVRNSVPQTKILMKDKLAFLEQIDNLNTNALCTTCRKYIMKGDVPNLASTPNLKFVEIPECIQRLTPLAEIFVSPIINFMQIRELKPHSLNSQLGIKGSIVNIPVEIPTMIDVLPRKFEEMHAIQVTLKRSLLHKSAYQAETISPANICDALTYLLETPLFKKHNIQIDQEFFNRYEHNHDETLEFIVEDEDYETANKEELRLPTNDAMEQDTFCLDCNDSIESTYSNDGSDDEDDRNNIADDEIMMTDFSRVLANQLTSTHDPSANDTITIAPEEHIGARF